MNCIPKWMHFVCAFFILVPLLLIVTVQSVYGGLVAEGSGRVRKSIIKFDYSTNSKMSKRIFIVTILYCFLPNAYALAETCQWIKVSSQIWNFQDIRNWSEDISCWVQGSGTPLSDPESSSQTYIIEVNDRRTREYISSHNKYSGSAIQWGCISDRSCCEQGMCGSYLNNSTGTRGLPVWPPCTTNYSLPPLECGSLRYPYQYCEGCSANEHMWRHGWYMGNPYCVGKSVISRINYQLLCTPCTQAQLNAKISECGGASNLLHWDNDSCTGRCEGQEDDSDKNSGPPCPTDQE